MADGVFCVLDVLFYKILLDSDGLRQVTGLVNVKSLGYGHMVAEELERNDREERSQGHECWWHLDVVVDQVLHLLVALGHHSSDTTLAGDDLLIFSYSWWWVARKTTGISLSISAIGPCFISAAGYPSAWI